MKKIALLLLSAVLLCMSCVAQASSGKLPAFASIREAVDSTEGYLEIHEYKDHIVLILEQDDAYFRMVVLLDDRAKDLYPVDSKDGYTLSDLKAFEDYAFTLPPAYTEEMAEKPMDQAELDALKGKTLRDLMDEGFGEELLLSADELAAPVTVSLEYGAFRYEFEVDNAASGYPDQMKVKSAKYAGFSRAAFDAVGSEILPGLLQKQ